MRLKNWLGFLLLCPAEASWLIETHGPVLLVPAGAESALGVYSSGVPAFLATEYNPADAAKIRFFAARAGGVPPEHGGGRDHEPGTASGVRAHARKCAAPACMRGRDALACQARISGPDSECTGCTTDCAVNGSRCGCEAWRKVFLVPHSSGFSRCWRAGSASRIQANRRGVLANILQGGYEMRAVEFDLNACCSIIGLPETWRRNPCATDLNESGW